jgi:predicted Zn-dependent peptidase
VKAWEHAVVQHFWSKWYFPGNVTLYIVGDLDRSNEEVIRLIEASFGGFPAGGLATLAIARCWHVLFVVG